MKVLPKFFNQKDEQRQAAAYRALLRAKGQIGGKLFGAIAEGHHREFFCLDEHTWIWHEEWLDKAGQRKTMTTRYDVRPGGVLKAHGDNPYQPIAFEEAVNLYQAVELYERHVDNFYRSRVGLAA